HWCEEVMSGAMRQQHGAVDVVGASSARDLGLALLRSRGRPLLVRLEQAPGAFATALREAGRKLVVVQEDPLTALFECVQRDGGDLAAAVRAVASGCASASLYMTLPQALVLSPPGDGAKAALLLEHLGLGAVAALPPARKANDLVGWWRSLKTEDQTMIAGAFNPASQSPATFDWAPGLFWREGGESGPAKGPVDITGRARCLLTGPRILLPLGRWRLSLRLA